MNEKIVYYVCWTIVFMSFATCTSIQAIYGSKKPLISIETKEN